MPTLISHRYHWDREAGTSSYVDERYATEQQEMWLQGRKAVVVPHAIISRLVDGETVPMNDHMLVSVTLAPNEKPVYWVNPEGMIVAQPNTPYPWCWGNPTRAHCVANGYCRQRPTCGD